MSAGAKFKHAVAAGDPLQIVGVLDPFQAMLTQDMGFQALYLSGGGVANTLFGVPDTGITSMQDVLYEAKRIVANPKVSAPLLVDIDTGWDDPETTVRAFSEAGVAAVHMEDQVAAKLCGHLEGKQLVSKDEMVARIKSAVKGKADPDFVLMARVDAQSVEGLDAALERAQAYVAAGADMIFAEATSELADYTRYKEAIGDVPLLANMTEFGKTPLFKPAELKAAGVNMVLYPRTLERAMLGGAARAAEALKHEGTVEALLHEMLPRAKVNDLLNYDFEVSKAQKNK